MLVWKACRGLLILAALTIASIQARAEVRIGAVLSSTGPVSFLGEPERLTLELYAASINKAGGINGEQIRLIVYDDGGDANASRTFATRLVESDKVDAVIGGSGTGNSLAMLPVFEEAGVPYVSLSGGVEIIDPVRRWVFKPPHTDLMACQTIFADLRRRSLKRVAFIAGQGGFAKSMVRQCRTAAPSYDIEIAAEESYGPRDSDMTPQLNRIKAVPGLQAVINADIGQGPAVVTRGYRQLGVAAPLYLSHAAATSGYLQLAGPAAHGVLLPGPSLLIAADLPDDDASKPMLLAYKTTFESATGKSVDAFGGYAHDAILLLADALRRAGSKDKSKVRDALEATKGFLSTVGTINMSPTDHLGIDLSSFRMLTVTNGAWAAAR